MSLNRYNARRDENEPEIVDALIAVGALVMRISGKGQPDLLVCFRKQLYVFEVKRPKTRTQAAGRATKAQDARSEEWPVSLVRSGNEALRVIGAIR